MEKEQAQSYQEVFENDIVLYLRLFCEENHISDIKKESQSVWNGALRYIKKHVFPVNGILKSKQNIRISNNSISSNFNAYDYEKVNDVCDIYIDLCMVYDKEISLVGFSNLTGIHIDTLIEWGKDHKKLNSLGYEVSKKLYQFREESLSNKLISGKQNPVGILGVLNRHYQWNLPGVSREQTTSKRALSANDLPKLGEEILEIVDKKEENQYIVDDCNK